ncbi:MAG TPA: hypothetical protein VGC30_06710 [Dokdonella sp.]
MSPVSPPAAEARPSLPDETRFEILNAIYLRKMAPAAHVADVVGRPLAEVERVLAEEEAAGALLGMEGAYLLQPAGMAEVVEFYRETYAPLREQGEIVAWYERFESTLNQQFIKAVSDWQTSGGDDRARDRMTRLVERMIRSLGQITAAIPRYARYAERFERAMAKADQGQTDYVCKPTVDSMHNVWFEFHEDVLAVMGRPRDV